MSAQTIETCSRCLLTTSAEQLLSRLEADLRSTRGDDGSWTAHACPDCGRTTLVADVREGWTFGDSGWSFEPDGEKEDASVPSNRPVSAPDLGVADVPEWVTAAEAAYLSGSSLSTITSRLEGGRLEHVDLFEQPQPGSVLIRSADVLATRDADERPTKPAPSPPAPPAPGRRRWRRAGNAVLTVLTLALIGVAVYRWTHPPGVDDEPSRAGAPPEVEAGSVPTDPAVLANATVVVSPARFAVGDGWVSATASVSNSGDRWLPDVQVTFLVLDASGVEIGSGSTTLDLDPDEIGVAVADAIPIEPADAEVLEVRVMLVTGPERDPDTSRGTTFVDDASVEGDHVTVRLVNVGPAIDTVRVDCAVDGPADALSAVVSDEVGPLAEGELGAFDLKVEHRAGALDAATCSTS